MAVQTKTEHLISLENINKSDQQPKAQQITILENISLELRQIKTSIEALPTYIAPTLLRMIRAYFLSLVFPLVYADTAYRSQVASKMLIPWAEKFKFETVEIQNSPQSVVLDFWRRSHTLQMLKTHLWKSVGRGFGRGIWQPFPNPASIRSKNRSWIVQWLNWLLLSGVTFIVLWGTWEAAMLLRVLDWAEWQTVMIGAILTAMRVLTALVLSLAWTVPVGVAIDRNPRLAQILQRLVQIAASVSATTLFPVLLLALTQLGGGLQIGSIVLMMLGTMWYVLFNVIAGAQWIPCDLFEAARVYKRSRWQRWKTLILAGIIPYLITGIITAVGGARTMPVLSANTSTLKVESLKR